MFCVMNPRYASLDGTANSAKFERVQTSVAVKPSYSLQSIDEL